MVGAGATDAAGIRTVVLASADMGLRQRLRASLMGLRWQVREAGGGAEAMAQLEASRPEALLVDSWLPDLEAGEFAGQVRLMYPGMELLRVDGGVDGVARSPRRNELLHALREAQSGALNDTAAWVAAPMAVPKVPIKAFAEMQSAERELIQDSVRLAPSVLPGQEETARATVHAAVALPDMVGVSEPMRELARLIRLVAPRSTTVLIEGETGTGKEVVARAVHRLSERAGKPFAVLNCAAIPEALLEAELFGHTRGAFTGAVQSRTGRIEAAHGGTLFLDEIGEMPMALQAKMLRFLECGELQRVGDNETMRVDVRVIAATHQPLEQRAEEGTFRLDLYHRLAVFPVEVPALRDRMEDMGLLAEHILERMGQEMPRKRLTSEAEARLHEHHWPGNVRELIHVLERGAILSGDRMEIGAEEIRFRRATRG
ncbi:MAG: putative two component, sigma54 specific, transcriptional regulator, Fis family [Edaphobacter sp.]|nr:putative two component, sigma54 specific, transcriptional regulator, Fis family [Edaphobacter sp.]